MAELEHIRVLEQGVESWNRWRRENPEIRPDLSYAILGSCNLSGSELQSVNLSKCYLKKANLCGVNLYRSNLRGAYLHRANLDGAILNQANLRGACLMGSNLSEADLYLTNLSGANLRYANLSGIRRWEAIRSLQFTDIYGAKKAPGGFRRFAKEKGDLFATKENIELRLESCRATSVGLGLDLSRLE